MTQLGIFSTLSYTISCTCRTVSKHNIYVWHHIEHLQDLFSNTGNTMAMFKIVLKQVSEYHPAVSNKHSWLRVYRAACFYITAHGVCMCLQYPKHMYTTYPWRENIIRCQITIWMCPGCVSPWTLQRSSDWTRSTDLTERFISHPAVIGCVKRCVCEWEHIMRHLQHTWCGCPNMSLARLNDFERASSERTAHGERHEMNCYCVEINRFHQTTTISQCTSTYWSIRTCVYHESSALFIHYWVVMSTCVHHTQCWLTHSISFHFHVTEQSSDHQTFSWAVFKRDTYDKHMISTQAPPVGWAVSDILVVITDIHKCIFLMHLCFKFETLLHIIAYVVDMIESASSDS